MISLSMVREYVRVRTDRTSCFCERDYLITTIITASKTTVIKKANNYKNGYDSSKKKGVSRNNESLPSLGLKCVVLFVFSYLDYINFDTDQS